MIAATAAVQRPADARLLAVNQRGQLSHHPRTALASLLQPGDLIVANDAATLPASLVGQHEPTGRAIEVRLAGRASLAPDRVQRFRAIVFGDGDFHVRTEDRPAPPALHTGDRLALGPLRARVERLLDHPRLALLAFDGTPASFWAGLASHGRPIQYSHLPEPLAMWDTWTAIAATPAAFEPPSAGFILSWDLLESFRVRGVRVATLTHAAGISSTGDPELDARLPFDEPYSIPFRTSALIDGTRTRGGRIIALGTTVVRALEHAATGSGQVRPGSGIATQRIGADTPLYVVDAVVTGTHERGTSHHDLLRAFVDDDVLERMDAELDARAYRTHEFGDSILVSAGVRVGRPEGRPSRLYCSGMSVTLT